MIDSPLGGDEEPDLQGLAGAEPDIPAPAGTGAPLGDDDRVLLVFSYLGPLSLVAFAAARREYVRWHARQGTVFFALAFAIILMATTADGIAWSLHWFLGRMIGLVTSLVYLCLVGIAFLGIVKALRGERWRLPFISDLADWL